MPTQSETKKREVWVWLPGKTIPVEAGLFAWSEGRGRFQYRQGYKEMEEALALDPVGLPFSRSLKPMVEMGWNGMFGVFRDAAPEGFGLEMLCWRLGVDSLAEIEKLGLSSGDSVGAIEVCTPAQLERKMKFTPPEIDRLRRLMQQDVGEYSSSRTIQTLMGEEDSTSLGGEKPKVTVLHGKPGEQAQWWIAKLPQRTGPAWIIEREFVAMSLARVCGLEVAETQMEKMGAHSVLLVKRFDREVTEQGVTRNLFASSASVMGERSVDPLNLERSYPSFSGQLQRWCASAQHGLELEQQEVWRRMAFNALVGNYDDHSRNHGLLFRKGRWGMSPAYDIVAMSGYRGVLSMGVTPDGSRRATAQTLTEHASLFSMTKEQAWSQLQSMARSVNEGWLPMMVQDCGVPQQAAESLAPAFALAKAIAQGVQAPDPEKEKKSRRTRT